MAKDKQSSAQNEKFQVPEDFPKRIPLTSLPGAQLKIAMTKYDGHYYPAGDTPPERFERYQYCLQLAEWFMEKCVRNAAEKYKGLSQDQIIDQYHARLQATRSTAFPGLSEQEAAWILSKCAESLGWPLPISLHKWKNL
jgi:hypothetical protein